MNRARQSTQAKPAEARPPEGARLTQLFVASGRRVVSARGADKQMEHSIAKPPHALPDDHSGNRSSFHSLETFGALPARDVIQPLRYESYHPSENASSLNESVAGDEEEPSDVGADEAQKRLSGARRALRDSARRRDSAERDSGQIAAPSPTPDAQNGFVLPPPAPVEVDKASAVAADMDETLEHPPLPARLRDA